MKNSQPKKQIILKILEILKDHSDEAHTLSQKDIADLLLSEYGIAADRKTVHRNLVELVRLGYDIEYTELHKTVADKKTGVPVETDIWTDFYIHHDFEDSELRLLIDSILFSKHIPNRQRSMLIGKLEGLSNKYFHSGARHIVAQCDNLPQSKQLFYTIETLDEAISQGRKVRFKYAEYHSDKKLHVRRDSSGKPRIYLMNPYQMAAANSRYYLICNNDDYDDVANYRIDRIMDIELTDQPVKPMQQVRGMENGFNLPKHMAEHIYMFQDRSINVTFRTRKALIGDMMDWFGNDITFFDEDDESISAKVYVNRLAMRKWALQYALDVKILTPQTLVDEIKADLKTAAENYEQIK